MGVMISPTKEVVNVQENHLEKFEGFAMKKEDSKEYENVKYTTTILYMIDGKEYTKNFDCPNCNEDLAKEDKAIIEKARNDGKDVKTVMC